MGKEKIMGYNSSSRSSIFCCAALGGVIPGSMVGFICTFLPAALVRLATGVIFLGSRGIKFSPGAGCGGLIFFLSCARNGEKGVFGAVDGLGGRGGGISSGAAVFFINWFINVENTPLFLGAATSFISFAKSKGSSTAGTLCKFSSRRVLALREVLWEPVFLA